MGSDVGSLTPNPSPAARERGIPLPRPQPAVRQQARYNRKTPTKSESIFWRAVRNRRFAGQKFRRQYAVGPFILDFYCPELRLAVEIDGPIHEYQTEADQNRQRAIESFGVRFVRISSAIVEHKPDLALEQVYAALNLPSPAHGRGAGGEG
jgi:very-short-patch-repair endonuclease